MAYCHTTTMGAIPTPKLRASVSYLAGGVFRTGVVPSWTDRRTGGAGTWLQRAIARMTTPPPSARLSGMGITSQETGAAAGTVVLGPGVGTAIGTAIGGLIKTSAAGPNRDAAAQVWPLAAAGNLAAVEAFLSRETFRTVTSAAPWKAGADALRKNSDLIAQTQQAVASGAIPPGFANLPPEQVFPAVSRYHVMYNGGATTGGTGVTASPIPAPVGPSLVDQTIRNVAAGFFATPAGAQVARQGATGAAQGLLSQVTPMLPTLALVGLGALVLSRVGAAGGQRRRYRRNAHRTRRRARR